MITVTPLKASVGSINPIIEYVCFLSDVMSC